MSQDKGIYTNFIQLRIIYNGYILSYEIEDVSYDRLYAYFLWSNSSRGTNSSLTNVHFLTGLWTYD